MLSFPATPPILIAYEIGLIFEAGVECYGKEMVNESMSFINESKTALLETNLKKLIQEATDLPVN
jgi:hypothetical protein